MSDFYELRTISSLLRRLIECQTVEQAHLWAKDVAKADLEDGSTKDIIRAFYRQRMLEIAEQTVKKDAQEAPDATGK